MRYFHLRRRASVSWPQFGAATMLAAPWISFRCCHCMYVVCPLANPGMTDIVCSRMMVTPSELALSTDRGSVEAWSYCTSGPHLMIGHHAPRCWTHSRIVLRSKLWGSVVDTMLSYHDRHLSRYSLFSILDGYRYQCVRYAIFGAPGYGRSGGIHEGSCYLRY